MSRTPATPLRHAAALLLALSAAIITACGGGGETGADVAAAGERASAYAAGPISGFGSVIVNGVRYDDSAASVLDDDDAPHSRSELKLGMMVEVDASGLDAARASGKAHRIRFGSEIVGPVAGVDVAAGTLLVLGQTVQTRDTTVFDDNLPGGLAALVAGTVVEVHALFDAASGHYVAARVEGKPAAAFYKLRGLVANLDPVAKTFTIGTELINYAGIAAADLPATLADGQRVRVRLQTAQVAGQWVAAALRSGVRKLEDRAGAHLRGAITRLTSATDFEIDGLKVNAAAASFPDGSAGVVLGARVEVEGRIEGGVLVARKVELDDHHAGERHRFELHGLVSGLNSTAKTFTLRGVTVSYAGSVAYKHGTEADLAEGRKVEVKGIPSADRTTLEATTIEFES